MVDAVFSSVTTSTLIRATEQVSSSRANSEKVQAAPQAPYVSPYIGRDQESQKVVIQIRNGETGKVIEQIPSRPEEEKASTPEHAQQTQQQAQQQQPAPTEPQPSGQSTPAVSSASFGAFAKQVASLQSGGGTGSTVSISA